MVFLHPFRQKKSQNASAGVPKRRRESAHRRDEATLAPSVFVAEKACKKNGKIRNRKRAQGTVGFGARDFVHGANATEPKKLRSPGGRRSENPFFERSKKYLKITEKWMLKNPPGPRRTDALRFSGSGPNRAQKKRATN